MLTEAQLRDIAREKSEDAEAMLGGGRYKGAIYICGYAVEIALKARICASPDWTGYPEDTDESKRVDEILKEVKTHKLETLLVLAKEVENIKKNFLVDWSIVKGWNPESRYKPAAGADEFAARGMIDPARIILGALGI